MKLTIKNMRAGYAHEVLHDISAGWEEPRLVAVIGPNGSGKTTFLKSVAGLHGISGGAVFIDEQDIRSLSHQERSWRIGFVPQEEDTFLPFTVEQIVLMGRSPYMNFWGFASADHHRKVTEILELLDLNALREKSFLETSGGERRRAMIGRALAQETPLLVMDEPTTHLDLHHQIQILEISRRLVSEKQKTIILSIHDLNMAALYADDILLFHQGHLYAQGRPKDVLHEQSLAEVFRTKAQVVLESSKDAEESRPHFRIVR